ncbi:MAG: GIY-YIG nuclease family protein, partial [Bacilli bacterium]
MTDQVKQALLLVPHKPGIYLMKDRDGEIIYVGKAKDLNKRVTQYFLRPQS